VADSDQLLAPSSGAPSNLDQASENLEASEYYGKNDSQVLQLEENQGELDEVRLEQEIQRRLEVTRVAEEEKRKAEAAQVVDEQKLVNEDGEFIIL
jgi:hypothetical protein